MAKLLSGTRIYGTGIIDTSLQVGNSTVNTSINTSAIFVGNSTTNTNIGTSSISFGNASVNVVINSTSVFLSGSPLTGTNTSGSYVWSNTHLYTGRVGYANSSNVSVAYSYYNQATGTIDTVWG